MGVTFVDKPIIENQPDVLVSKEFYPHYATSNVDVSIMLDDKSLTKQVHGQ